MFSPDIIDQYGSQGFIGWSIIFFAVYCLYKMVKAYRDSGHGDF